MLRYSEIYSEAAPLPVGTPYVPLSRSAGETPGRGLLAARGERPYIVQHVPALFL